MAKSNETSVHTTLEAANEARTGRKRLFKAMHNGRTVWVIASNATRAGNAAYLEAGGAVEQLTKVSRAPKTAAEMLAAIAAMPEAEQAEVRKGLKRK